MNCDGIQKKLPPIKTGDSWGLVGTYKEDGEPVDIFGFQIRCQMRTSGSRELIADMVVTIDPDQTTNTGKFYVAPSDPDTEDWPVGTHSLDIEFNTGGIIRSTDTFFQQVIRDVTR